MVLLRKRRGGVNMILYSNAYVVNKYTGIERRESNEDLVEYISFIVKAIEENKNTTYYKEAGESTQVIALCKKSIDIIKDYIDKVSFGNTINEIESNCNAILSRFSMKEAEAQEIVERLKVTIRPGCVVQAIINGNDKLYYLISKMDFDDFLDDQNLKKATGIYISEKRLGKSCLISFNVDDSIDKIQILLDNPAVYFYKKFLEVEPIYNDSQSTAILVSTVLAVVQKELKKYPKEHLELRNTFIHYTRSNGQINYNDLKEEVFNKYFETSEIEKPIIDKINKTLDSLPEKRGFSRQFNRVLESINVRKIKYHYNLNNYFELTIKEYEEDEIYKTIESGEDETTGRKYIKVYTENTDVLTAFKSTEQ